MIAPMLVVAAHLLDAFTFQLAVDRYGLWGESNLIAHMVIGAIGMTGLAALKLAGGVVAGGLVLRLRRSAEHWRLPVETPLILAAGMGLMGAAVNTAALVLWRTNA